MQNPHATALMRFSTAALPGIVLGLGALAATGCGSGAPVAAAPSTTMAAAATAGAAPVAVNCGPGQQALIRPGLVAGQAISQVDCVPVSGLAGTSAVGYAGGPVAAGYYDAPRLVEAPVAYRPAARPVAYRTAPAPRAVQRRSGRSWQKSALVIGSSAGAGAGVGGAVKGKKGALLGAAIGGGVATLWDQATRRK